MDWEGTACSFVLTGIGATLTLFANVTLASKNAAHITVFVNDYDAGNFILNAGAPSYLLTAATQFAANNITVHYASEPVSSGASRDAGQVVSFFGFSAGNGGGFAAPAPLQRRIDVIGDSITAGSGYDKLESVNGPLSFGTGCHPWAPMSGYSQSYAWETHLSRFFCANATTIAWSGKGLIHNSGCSAGPLMPALYQQTFATSAAERWDFASASRPDLVIIYLGSAFVSAEAILSRDSLGIGSLPARQPPSPLPPSHAPPPSTPRIVPASQPMTIPALKPRMLPSPLPCSGSCRISPQATRSRRGSLPPLSSS